MLVREAGRPGTEGIAPFTGVLEPIRARAIYFLRAGMDAGGIRKQDPALLLFMLYTAVVDSLIEASVFHAKVGEDEEGVAAAPHARGGNCCETHWGLPVGLRALLLGDSGAKATLGGQRALPAP